MLCSICLSPDHDFNACPLKSKFKNSEGHLLKRALFWEESPKKDHCIYTLKDFDYKGYLSLYRLYMDMEDLTEYTFATTYFFSWNHWLDVCETSWFKDHIARWRTELELKLKARAIKEIKMEAQMGGKNAFQANKWIIDRGWVTEGSRRGRPSKSDIKREAQNIAFSNEQIKEYMKRLGLDQDVKVQ